MLSRFIFLAIGLAIATQTQLFGDGDGQYADFPSVCTSHCETFESAAATCAIGDDASSETASLACICTAENAQALQSCSSCIVANTDDLSSSNSAAVAQQRAISFARGCGLPLTVEGVDPQVSSVLADGSADHASQRSALLTQSVSKTVSNGMEVTVTLPASNTPSTASPASSPSGSSDPPAATQSGGNGAVTSVASIPVARDEADQLLVRPAPEAIASKTTLQERLARLRLPDGAVPPPQSSSQPSSSGVRTGRTTRLSDTISRFQANAEAEPLRPEGGSFGLAPARPRVSAGGSQDRGEVKPRVASLGGGRAAVPLNVVKPRSASENNSSAARSEGSGSAPGSRAASRQGSELDDTARPETPVGESTPVPSPTASTSSVLEKPARDTPPTSLSLPSGLRSPGAMSVSSMNVETGSLSSEDEVYKPAESPSLADEAHSPLSSPQLAGLVVSSSSVSSSASIAFSDDVASAILPAAAAGKGPLDGLRISSRTNSVGSLSSMIVEAPVDDVADLEAMASSAVATPTAEVADLNLNGSEAPPTPTRDEPEQTEEQRAFRTKEELAEYEKDEADPIAYGAGRNGDSGGEPHEPPPFEGEEASMERPDTPIASEPAQAIQGETKMAEEGDMPKVKCNDCAAEVDLMELADHSCAASKFPPALGSPPASPQNNNLATLSPSTSMHSLPDAPQEADEATPSMSSPTRSPRNFASSSPAGLSRSSSHQSHKSKHSPTAILDRFVPQTPEDVPEDILDDYTDEPIASRSVPPPRDLSVPEDVEDDSVSAPPLPLRTATSSSSMTRSASSPAHTPAAASQLRAQKKAAGPRSHSVYGIPGQYISSDDEEGEPGSVTIVRSSRA
ncbi:hypothetical protein JCM11251_001249 [Rhodosporidiobolus azoricus]